MSNFGLIGKNIEYSYSKKLHEAIGSKFSLDIHYDLIDCQTSMDLTRSITLLKEGFYRGLNVTIPYKETIMDYCEVLTEEASSIKAVNTLYMKDGKLVGDNTDYYGFLKILEFYHINLNQQVVYILGSGGASKSVGYALKTLGVKQVVISRKADAFDNNVLYKTYEFLDKLPKIDCIVNTTPIGTYPKIHQMPVSKRIADKTNIVIDLIYNPKQTQLIKSVNFGINGAYMLIGQAIKAQSIWQNIKLEETQNIFDQLLEALK
ncbi:MAG: shikimate dehydrogenase [Acholeplasma sp.]|nr:shikimate dehydrogenase [Acholeplasma sp.]